MATIVGDKLKLSNYSYLLTEDGTAFIPEFQIFGNRTRQEKLIDAVDLDWRPFRLKNFTYTYKSIYDPTFNVYTYTAYTTDAIENVTYTYITDPGDLFDTTRLLDFISYAYSMGYNLDFNGYIYHNKEVSNVYRPNMISNIGWVDRDSRIIGYTYWPSIGAQYRLDNEKSTWEGIYNSNAGEIFNDYTNNAASGSYSHAEGYKTTASSPNSHSEGTSTTASGNSSHAEGNASKALGINSHAEGYKTTSEGLSSHAEGNETKANAQYSHAEGYGVIADGESSHAEGSVTIALGKASHAEGIGNVPNVRDSSNNIIINFGSNELLIADGIAAHAEGVSTQTTNLAAHAEGIHTYATGAGAHSEGALTYAKQYYSHAEGYLAYAFGEAAHAEGVSSLALGKASHAEGSETKATGINSHAEGYKNTVSGNYSHVEGNSNQSSSEGTHVSGKSNIETLSNYSIVTGRENNLDNSSLTHVGGENNKISNSGVSHIFGIDNKIDGLEKSVLFGTTNTVGGSDSFIFGQNSYTDKGKNILLGDSILSYGTETTLIGERIYNSGGNFIGGKNIYAYTNNSLILGNLINVGTLSSSRSDVVAIGQNITTTNDEVVSIGGDIITSGKGAYSFGNKITTSSNNSFSVGSNINNSGASTYSLGYYIANSGTASFLTGSTINNTGASTYSFGYTVSNTGAQSFLIGSKIDNKSASTYTFGYSITNNANSAGSFLVGSTINNTGKSAYILGYTISNIKDGAFLIGNKLTNTGASAYLFGDTIISSGTNAFSIGRNITANGADDYVFGKMVYLSDADSVGIGRTIITYGSSNVGIGNKIYIGKNDAKQTNIYAIGEDLVTYSSNSIVIGKGLETVDSTTNDNLIIGKYNKTLASGYYFALGDGTSDNRHNAIEITNNGWTYITALATYVNNITTTEQNVGITYDMNFVQLYSYKEIKRGINGNDNLDNGKNTNTYNLNFNTYILPTKRYVDKLLAAKDVFRFAGTFTPSYTTYIPKDNGKNTTVTIDIKGTWNPAHTQVADTTNDKEYSYSYAESDFSKGAIWKTTSNGWFGNTYVSAGDLLISYDDAATGTKNTNWAIIDTQINFVENWGTYSTYIGNGAPKSEDYNINDLRNYIVTNIHLSQSGYLSYTYSPIMTEYRFTPLPGQITNLTNDTLQQTERFERKDNKDVSYTHRNQKYLTNICLLKHDDRIEIAYTYADFGNFLTYSNYSYSLHRKANINNTEVDHDGIDGKVKEGIASGNSNGYLNDTDGFTYISEVNLNSDGILSYTKTSITKLRTHHDNVSYSTVNFDIDNDIYSYSTKTGAKPDGFKVITEVNLTNSGTLTYQSYQVANFRKHHHTTTPTFTAYRTTHREAYIYNYGSYTGNGLLDTYNAETKPNGYQASTDIIKVIDNLHLDKYGTITYTVSYVNRLRHHHDTQNSTTITYYSTHKDKYLFKPNDESNYVDTYKGTGAVNTTTNPQITNNDLDSILFIDNVHLNQAGTLSYTGRQINRLRNHHDNQNGNAPCITYSTHNVNTFVSTYVANEWTDNINAHYQDSPATAFTGNAYNKDIDEFTAINNVHLDKKGTLSYAYITVKNLRKHHGYVSYGAIAYDIDADFGNMIGTNPNGQSYHDANSSKSKNYDYLYVVGDVSLTDKGVLTYTRTQLQNLKHHHHTVNHDNKVDTTDNTKGYRQGLIIEQSKIINSIGADNINKDEDKIKLLTYAYLSNDGTLYTYSATLSGLANHHNTSKDGPTVYNTYVDRENYIRDVKILDTKETNKITFLDGVNLSTDGKLTYHYSTIDDLRQHHTYKDTTFTIGYDDQTNSKYNYRYHAYNVGEYNIALGNTKENGCIVDEFGFISNVHLSSNGLLTYTTDKISNLKTHHGTGTITEFEQAYNIHTSETSGTNKIGFVSAIDLDENGMLTYSIDSIDNLRDHHDDSFPVPSTNFNGNNFVTDVQLTTKGELKGLFGKFTYTGINKTEDNKDTQYLNAVIGINIDGTGKISYCYSEIGNIKHAESAAKFDHTLTIKHHGVTKLNAWDGSSDAVVNLLHSGSVSGDFLTSVKLEAEGELKGTAGTFVSSQSHDSTNWVINKNDTSTLTVVTKVDINSDGEITYYTKNIQDHLHHHDGSSGSYNFLTQVDLSTDGLLTGGGGSFTNNHNYSTTPASRTSQGTVHGHQSGNVVLLSYTYIGTDGGLRNRYETITLSNQKTTLKLNNEGTSTSNTIYRGDIGITVDTNDNNNYTATLTYHTDSIWGTI